MKMDFGQDFKVDEMNSFYKEVRSLMFMIPTDKKIMGFMGIKRIFRQLSLGKDSGCRKKRTRPTAKGTDFFCERKPICKTISALFENPSDPKFENRKPSINPNIRPQTPYCQRNSNMPLYLHSPVTRRKSPKGQHKVDFFLKAMPDKLVFPSLKKKEYFQYIERTIGFKRRERGLLPGPGESDDFNPIVLKRWVSSILCENGDLVSSLDQFLCKISSKHPGKGIFGLRRIGTGCDA
jgi:hypothetical protein